MDTVTYTQVHTRKWQQAPGNGVSNNWVTYSSQSTMIPTNIQVTSSILHREFHIIIMLWVMDSLGWTNQISHHRLKTHHDRTDDGLLLSPAFSAYVTDRIQTMHIAQTGKCFYGSKHMHYTGYTLTYGRYPIPVCSFCICYKSWSLHKVTCVMLGWAFLC